MSVDQVTVLMLRGITLVIFSVLLLAACSDPTPPIARGLSKSLAPMSTKGAFDERIKQRFPIGREEAYLIQELRSERFIITPVTESSSPYRFSAIYENHSLVCKESWTVNWSADQGKITDIEGRVGQVCL
jgi:hypothetical protein